MLISTEGIVLKQHKIAGNRRMITIFSRRYGRIQAGTAMNERGKNRSALALRPFTFAEYEIFKNRGYYNINNASVKRSFFSIGENLDRFMAGSRALEYLEKILLEEQPQPALFDLTMEFFEALETASGDCNMMLYAFIVKTLPILGIMPELKCCANCGKEVEPEPPHYFSIEAGGILCKNCFQMEMESAERQKGYPAGSVRRKKAVPKARELLFTVDFDIVGVMQYFAKRPFQTFSKISLRPEYRDRIRHIISSYLNYYLSIDILDEEALK